jgi:ABC-type transport system involved in cytochrome c biogenesis permease subunit
MPEDLLTTIGLLLALLVACAATVLAWRDRRKDEAADGRLRQTGSFIVAVICLLLFAYRAVVVHDDWEPLQSHVDGLLLLLGLCAVLVAYLQWVGRLRGVELFALPLLVVMLLWAVCASWWSFARFDIAGVWDVVHLFSVYLGAAALAMAGVAGVMYLYAQHQLKRKASGRQRLQTLNRIAPLERIEQIGSRAALVGFVLLTVVLVAGAIRAASGPTVLGSQWWLTPKVIGSVIVWLLFGAVIHVRRAPALRGVGAAVMSIAGFLLLLAVLAMTLAMGGCATDGEGRIIISSDETGIEYDTLGTPSD